MSSYLRTRFVLPCSFFDPATNARFIRFAAAHDELHEGQLLGGFKSLKRRSYRTAIEPTESGLTNRFHRLEDFAQSSRKSRRATVWGDLSLCTYVK